MSGPKRRVLPPKKLILWRFVTGNHLDGKRRTNATWLREGTSPKHLCNWWNRKPRLYRALWRDIPVLIAIGELVALNTSLPLFIGLNVAGIPIGIMYVSDKLKAEPIVKRKVTVDLGGKADDERDVIDAIGYDEIEEDRGATTRIVKMNRKRA